MGHFDDLRVIRGVDYPYDRQDEQAHWLVSCPACDSGTMLAVAVGRIPVVFSEEIYDGKSGWLMCSVCGMGAFAVGRQHDPAKVYPRPHPFPVPRHLEKAVEETWREALQTYSASAYTSCTLMCRKIIFHMAVEEGLPAKNASGFAPGFEQCVEHLVEKEFITPRQKRQWVDSIRMWGNAATHDLASVDKAVAYSALEFTHELLRMVYTFSAAAQEASSAENT